MRIIAFSDLNPHAIDTASTTATLTHSALLWGVPDPFQTANVLAILLPTEITRTIVDNRARPCSSSNVDSLPVQLLHTFDHFRQSSLVR